MKKSLFLLALMSALLWTGCEQPIEPEEITGRPEEKTPESLTLTIQAVKADAPETKGLDLGFGGSQDTTSRLKSIWKAGENVYVYNGTTYICTLTLGQDGNVIDENDAHKATLQFTLLTEQLSGNSATLTLLTPRETRSYEGQTGVLFYDSNASPDNSIEKNFHYTKATVEVTLSNDVVTVSAASFQNQQSIYRLSFRYGASTPTPISTKSVTIAAANSGLVQNWSLDGTTGPVTGAIEVKRASADENPFFVALRNSNTGEEAFTFTVIDNNGVTYRGGKTIPAEVNVNGRFISIKNATLSDRLDVPLNTSAEAAVGTAL